MATIAILGLGTFGQNLALSLSEQRQEILVIDKDAFLVSKFRTLASVAIEGDITDREFMERVGFRDVDIAVVCIAEKTDVASLAVLYLKEFGVGTIIAKVLSNDQEKILKSLGAHSVVFPERDAARELARRIVNPSLLMHLDWDEQIDIVERLVPEKLAGKRVVETDIRRHYRITILAIKKDRQQAGERFSLLKGDTLLEKGDRILVIGLSQDVEKFLKLK